MTSEIACPTCSAPRTIVHRIKLQDHFIIEIAYQCGAKLKKELPDGIETWKKKCDFKIHNDYY